MSSKPRLLTLSGQRVRVSELRIAKAKQFAQYLQDAGSRAFVKLREVRRQAEPPAETVAFMVTSERPQKLAHPIQRQEPLAATFPQDDGQAPVVISLRSDFPNVPHLNLGIDELPKSLCLYDQPYENMRLTWTPAEFLYRIHFWLSKTATGTLHGEDQPLEPLLATSGFRLVLPADFDISDPNQKPRPFNLFRVEAVEGQYTLRAVWQMPGQKINSVAAVFWCQPQQHGVINHQPLNLQQLQVLCQRAGLDIANELRQTLRQWFLDKPTNDILQAKIVLILALPKTRYPGGKTESIETRAFITRGVTVEELGRRLGLFDRHGATAGMIIGNPSIPAKTLESVEICLLQVLNALSPAGAAVLNGIEPCQTRIVAVGMGALGSQIYNNLVRGGYGRWTLIDNDVLLPHNCARHFLGDWAVGTNKAQTMAQVGKLTLNDPAIAQSIPADILQPAQYAEALNKALQDAEVLLDLSASVAVSRHLARLETKARGISAFLTPKGDGLVLAAEDSGRKIRLDWLEMLHYRGVLNEPALADSLQSKDARVRYGNSCRDISTELAQDDTALWAAIASKSLKQIQQGAGAALRLYRCDGRGITSLIEPEVSEPQTLRFRDWAIRIDCWVLEKLARFREARLPNETGGVLLGAFDTYHRVCSVIDVLPSPPDSTEWPTSYIRGCEGLAQKVQEVKRLTLDQISYVGEWHSHPRGASIRPSTDDLRAYGWLTSHMHAEALPGIMLIIGDRREFCLVSAEPS
ncbi:MAG TPA: Mov34/MPN/PAD-1 family protein [Terriglobia bacterium]|nr:Mov34/MPN/PAD-1 family protein [Terriglobia bacterium]